MDTVKKAGLLSNKKPIIAVVKATSKSLHQGTTPSLEDSPSDNLVKLTKCTDLELTNIMTGNYGEYTFTSGLSEESRQGLINRKPGKITRGCIAPSHRTTSNSLSKEVEPKNTPLWAILMIGKCNALDRKI